MRKIILLLILLSALGLGGLGIWYLNEYNAKFEHDLDQKTITENTPLKFNYFTNKEKDIYLVEFKGYIDLVYNPTTEKTAREISLAEQFIISTNGGYFNQDRKHAGLLIEYGLLTRPMAPNDAQITGVVILNKDSIDFKKANTIKIDDYLYNKDNIVFQTGPIIIQNNKINSDDIKTSVNGLGKYYRTVLGYTKSGKKFFAITTKTYDLETLSKSLLELDNLKGETINVINLDGGSSTYIYSNENKEFNISTFKTLPIILGVK